MIPQSRPLTSTCTYSYAYTYTHAYVHTHGHTHTNYSLNELAYATDMLISGFSSKA